MKTLIKRHGNRLNVSFGIYVKLCGHWVCIEESPRLDEIKKSLKKYKIISKKVLCYSKICLPLNTPRSQ